VLHILYMNIVVIIITTIVYVGTMPSRITVEWIKVTTMAHARFPPSGYTKQDLFERPTVAELRKQPGRKLSGDLTHIVKQIAALNDGETACLWDELIFIEHPLQFKKHAPVISVTSDLPPAKTLPRAVVEQQDPDVSGYGWWSGRMHKVPFVKLIEGAKLFAYEARKTPAGTRGEFEVRMYDDTPQTRTQGALASVQVSSRTSGHGMYTILYAGIPVDEHSSWRNVAAKSTCCLDRLWRDARYGATLDPRAETACSHMIAGYHKVAYAYLKQGNKNPAARSPFPVPSQELVDFFKRLDQVILVSERAGKEVCVPLNEAYAEKLLVERIRQYPDAAFGGKLLKLDWA
jgi:hypothetical protein